MKPQSSRIVIVGGGISGLATAFYLSKLGLRSTIVEQTGRLGGLIRTECVQGCHLEAGPDSFIATKPAVADLARDLGMADQLMGSNDRGRRIYVVRRGKLVSMPSGMVMMVPSHWKAALSSPLFSLRTKARFLREYTLKPRQRVGDFSIEDMMSQHFGQEAVTYLTEPLLSGVYGGNARSLSARSVLPRFVEYEAKYGSLIRSVRANRNLGKAVNKKEAKSGKAGTVPTETHARSNSSLFLSFAKGMQCLIDSLVYAVRDHAEILPERACVVRPTGLKWCVETDARSVEADQVVLGCPAYRSAELVAGNAQSLSRLLADIPYSSSVLATLLFRKDQVTHPLNGFGFLVPPPERRTIAAVTWINTKFPSRVAPGLVAIRAFLVDPEAVRCNDSPDADVIAAVLEDVARFMALRAVPVYSKVHRWPRSMPQYVVGHGERIARIQEELAYLPGLHLSSNFLDGVGIPDCVRHAKLTATLIGK